MVRKYQHHLNQKVLHHLHLKILITKTKWLSGELNMKIGLKKMTTCQIFQNLNRCYKDFNNKRK